jgi:putative transposase
VIQRSFRYRLYPTPEQETALQRQADAVRFVYNLALEQRRDFWRQALAHGVRLNFVTQGRDVTILRRQCEWLQAVSVGPLHQALRDLDKAFTNFFRGAGFPSFRRRDRHNSFRVQGKEFSVIGAGKWAFFQVPRIGRVKARLSRPLEGKIVNATYLKDALGWHVSVVCEIEHTPAPTALPSVGIDRGIANTVALSTGELLSTPDISALERRRRKAQRILARRKRGSNRYHKQRQRLSHITSKMARARAHWQHEISFRVASRFGHVVLEDLNIKGMVRANRGLSRSIHEQAWNGFAEKLTYKLEERGGTLTKVNPAYTSQTCSACGTIDKASRESQASFACRHCGFTIHADHNAAINILRRSTPRVEDSGCRSDEALTDALAA